MSDVILTTNESIEVLKALGEYRIKDIRHNAVLMTAIMKLNGQYVYQASAGSPVNVPTRELWVLKGEKVPLIKAVRHLLDMGLKEAKEYVEGWTGMARSNGDVVIPSWNVPNVLKRVNQGDVVKELRGYNVTLYVEPVDVDLYP